MRILAIAMAGVAATATAACLGTTIIHVVVFALFGLETSLRGLLEALCFNVIVGMLVAAPATLVLVPLAGVFLDEEFIPPAGALAGATTVVAAVCLFVTASPVSLGVLILAGIILGGSVGWCAARVHVRVFSAASRI